MRHASLIARFTRNARVMVNTLLIAIATVTFFFTSDVALPQAAAAYPFWRKLPIPKLPANQQGGLFVPTVT